MPLGSSLFRSLTSLPNRESKSLTVMPCLRRTLGLAFHGIGKLSNDCETDTPFCRRGNSIDRSLHETSLDGRAGGQGHGEKRPSVDAGCGGIPACTEYQTRSLPNSALCCRAVISHWREPRGKWNR